MWLFFLCLTCQIIHDERIRTRTVYALNDDVDTAFDYQALLREYQQYLPFVDAYYGSATDLPMQD